MPFDISLLTKPAIANLPEIGEVSLRVRSIDFLQWFNAGEKQDRWPDGHSFVRSLLRDRVAPVEAEEEDEGPGLPDEIVTAIDDDRLEAIAQELLTCTRTTFMSLRQVPKTDGEDIVASQFPQVSHDPPSAQLLTAARNYDADHKASQQRIIDNFARLGRIDRLGQEMKKYDSLLSFKRYEDLLAGKRKIEALADGGAFAALTGSIGSRYLDKSALAVSLTAFSPRDPFDPIAKMLGVSRTRVELWSSADRMLGLGIPDSFLNAMRGLDADPGIDRRNDIKLAGLFRTGFESVAALAIDGAIAQGAASDLLRSYDTDLEQAPLFRSVRDAVAALDDPETSDETKISLLAEILASFDKARVYARAQYEKAGIVAIVSLILAVLALYPELVPFREEPKPNREIGEAVETLKAIRSDLKSARDTADRRHIRYVHGRASLRATPERAGLVLRIVYPDQWVEVRNASGNWARVAVYDYASDTPVEGWIYRRHLRSAPE